MIGPQNQCRPLLRRQAGNGLPDLDRPFISQHCRVGTFRPDVHRFDLLDRREARNLHRLAIEADVHRDPMQPGRERRVSLELRQGAKRPHEGVLRQVAGILVIAGEPVAELIDPPLVSLHDRIESITLPRLRKPYELGVIHALHSTGLDRNVRRKSHPRSTYRLTFAFSLHIVRAMLPLTKRQREILDYLNDFIQQHGYAPSLEEIGRRFQLSSLATVHKHLSNLQDKGFIKRAWNRSRSVEMVPARLGSRAVELPMLGYVAAGSPIEAVVGGDTLAVPEDLVGKRDSYVLRVKGDSMIDEQIRDGDFVIVEDRHTAENGEMVIALLNGSDVTLKKLYREHGRIRLQPANPTMQPIYAEAADVQVRGVVVGVMRRY